MYGICTNIYHDNQPNVGKLYQSPWILFGLKHFRMHHHIRTPFLFTLGQGEGENSEGDIISCTFLPARVHPAWCFLHGIPVSDGEMLGFF